MLSGCTDAIRLISPALHTVSLLLYALSGLSQRVMSTDFTPTQTGERVALERYVNENKTHLNKSVFNQISSVPDLRKSLKVVSVCKGWCDLGWGFGMVCVTPKQISYPSRGSGAARIMSQYSVVNVHVVHIHRQSYFTVVNAGNYCAKKLIIIRDSYKVP